MQRILSFIDNFAVKMIGFYLAKNSRYSKIYALNYQLKTISENPIPGTWLELDWIANHPWDKYQDFDEDHYLNSFRRQGLINEICDVERRGIKGDFLEFGVYKGFSAYTMLVFGNKQRNYIGFDSFIGLSKPKPEIDGSHWKKVILHFLKYRQYLSLGNSVIV